MIFIFDTRTEELKKKKKSELLHIPDYNLYRKVTEGRSGGVGVYIRSQFNCHTINFDRYSILEMVFLFISITCANTKMCIDVLCRPPMLFVF